MKSAIAFSIPAFCALSLCGCWNGRVLYTVEQPFWDSLGNDLPTRIAVTRESLPRGYLPDFLVTAPPEDPAARLGRLLATGQYRTVVIGPLLSLQWRDYAVSHEHTHFILIGGEAAPDLPPNITQILYDRTGAYRSAGAAAAAAVQEEAGGQASATLGPRIGMLLSAAGGLTAAETDAFSSGVAGALNGGTPAVRTLAAPFDKNIVKAAIDQMSQEGVEVFLFDTGSFDPWCLEVLRSDGGMAVVADWAASRAFPRQVFLSIEEDVPGGIARALAAPAKEQRVMGPVHVVVGEAKPVSAAARALREGR